MAARSDIPDEGQIDFPIVYTNARAGWASSEPGVEGTDLRPLLDLLVASVPAPEYREGAALQALVTNLDASPYVGRLAICRVHNGVLRRGRQAGPVPPPANSSTGVAPAIRRTRCGTGAGCRCRWRCCRRGRLPR
jgi:predicted membrane GTPase involved in stress response